METYLYILLAIMVAFQCGIIIWVVIKNKQSDEKYERELDRIYGRKR